MRPYCRQFSGMSVELTRGDITHEDVDAIVNAANSELRGGGGVDGAIHRAGGEAILAECQKIRALSGPLPPGQAVITSAGRLPCRYVIHTVGPVWRGGGEAEAEILAACYKSCLALAEERGLRTIAFPSISTGAFGYPLKAAAFVALGSVKTSVEAMSPALRLVRFVLFSDADLATYQAALSSLH